MAHVLLREAGVCNNFKTFDFKGKRIDEIEIFCNRFAASFLVPREEFLIHNLLVGRSGLGAEDLDKCIPKLGVDFKVSRVVILRRLLTFGLITQPMYNEKVKFWSEDPAPRRKPGGVFSLTTVMKKNGRAFSSLVFESYRNKKISYASAIDYLGIKRKHMSAFERLLRSS